VGGGGGYRYPNNFNFDNTTQRVVKSEARFTVCEKALDPAR